MNKEYTLNQLFDLVAPIAICGGADCNYEKKAIAAWKKIAKIPFHAWTNYGAVDPSKDLHTDLTKFDLRNQSDFMDVYDAFARPSYDCLFEKIVDTFGDGKWEKTHDYYGARCFKRADETSKNVKLSGDACGYYPWFETAELLIERIKEIEANH